MENKNQSAFAMCMVDGTSGATLIEYGLSKREYFAGLFAQSMIYTFMLTNDEMTQIARQSINLADELLKQLENGK